MSWAYSLLIGPFEMFGFMRTALVACLALALANGPVGTLLLLRRMASRATSYPMPSCRERRWDSSMPAILSPR